MGLFSGLKRLGRGIGRGIKKGVKGLDKFDDWIKLKEIANIMQFVPGPQQAFFKPLAMVYAGSDVAKGIKNKDIMGTALSAAQMYGSSKIDTGGLAGRGASSLAPVAGEALPEGIQAAAGQVGGQSLRQAVQSNIGGNLKNYAGGVTAPLRAYAGLDRGSQFAIETLAPPLLYELSGKGNRQAERLRQAPSYDYQAMDTGQVQGFSPTTQFPTQAQGGITGDDWHQPINRLPANYEGWVTQPSLATLGEAGKEAVLPLNKLLPAMNKGGLNYSPGQAIVGEAGPEYVTRLGPGEEQYAQSILREQPVPQMREGSIAGGVARGVKHAAFPRTRPGANQGWLNSKLLKMLPKGAKLIPGLAAAFEAWQVASDASDLYQGRKGGYGWTQEGTEEYGLGGFLEDQMVNLGYASVAGIPLSAAYDWKRGQLNDLKDLLVDFGLMDPYRKYDVSPGTYAMLKAKANAQTGTQTPAQPGPQTLAQTGTQTSAQPGTQTSAQPGPQTSVQPGTQTPVQLDDPMGPLRDMVLREPPDFMEGRPSVDDLQSEWRDFGFPKERIDLSLLDNDNAEYWTVGEGSRYAPGRLYEMIRDLGYGDTREQVEEIQRNARDKGKWYRAVTKPPYSGMPTPYAGLQPG